MNEFFNALVNFIRSQYALKFLTIMGLMVSISLAALSVEALKTDSFLIETIKFNSKEVVNISIAVLGIFTALSAVSLLPEFKKSSIRLSKVINRSFEAFLGIESIEYIESANTSAKLKNIENDLRKLQHQVLENKEVRQEQQLSQVQFDKLVSGMTQRRIFEDVRLTVNEQLKDFEANKARSSILDDVFLSVIGKIERERRTLSVRTGLNVLAGILIAALGLILLWNFMSHVDSLNVDTTKAMIILSIRFGIVLFVAVFSLFFLNLFRAGLSDMKYYVNEHTNISVIYASAKLAVHLNDKELIKVICKKLLETERNFILKKGERTIGSAQTEGDMEYFDRMVSKLELPNFGRTLSNQTTTNRKRPQTRLERGSK